MDQGERKIIYLIAETSMILSPSMVLISEPLPAAPASRLKEKWKPFFNFF
jgi:hypothetical protein